MVPLTSWLPISSWQHFLGSSRRLYDYGCSAFKDYIAQYGRYPSENVDLLKNILASNESKDVDPISDEAIAAEIGSLLVGGTDTTSNVLTYLAYELAQQPEWQRRLRKEFEEHEVVFDGGVARFQQVQNLVMLNAVVSEGLRRHSAAVASLPRVVPKGGAEIAGVWVPGGVSSPETIHHT